MENYFYYDETSPSFIRNKVTRNSQSLMDSPAGTKNHDGYFQVMLNGKRLQVHRVIYELFFGEIPSGHLIDHIDGDPSNNSVKNLRLATHSQNSQNRKAQSNKKLLPKGISGPYKGAYTAQIIVQGVAHKKTSSNLNALEFWLKKMRTELHGDFSRNA